MDVSFNLNQDDLIKRIKLNYNHCSPRDLTQQIEEDFSNLSNLISVWLIKMFLNEDVVVDDQNWSEEETSSTDSENSSIFLFSECK